MPKSCPFETQLLGEFLGYVEAIAERRGHVLNDEVADYGSDFWALRVIEESWTGRIGWVSVFKQ